MQDGDLYAGDDAWTEWFKICSVHGCSRDHAAALRREIESAMYSQLARLGISREDAAGEDPVAFFDSYFTLRGEREGKKALKAYYAYRIVSEGKDLRDFVCGTLFGSGSGRVRDIVAEWVAVIKGWRRRTITSPGGARASVWEAAPAEIEAAERTLAAATDGGDAAAALDAEVLRREAEELLEEISREIKVEKAKVALYSLVTAMDVSLAEPVVIAALGVGKSRAYLVRDKVMAAMERRLKRMDLAGDSAFASLVVEVSARALDPDLRKEILGE